MNSGAADSPALTCTEWRGWSAQAIAPLLRAETDRWSREFHWDQRWSFTHIEGARDAGRLPGLIVTDSDGHTRGWTFFLRQGDQFQIGIVVSDSDACTRALVDGALASPLADDASMVVFSPDAPGLAAALEAHGVKVEQYDYLVRADTAGTQALTSSDVGTTCRDMVPTDLASVAALLGDAYRETTFLRPFVLSDAPADWRQYVGQLVDTRGCGEFLFDASVVVDNDSSRDPSGALLASRLSSDTGHIAQLVVSPAVRNSGVARRMLRHSIDALHGRGLARVSLLVARTNTRARRLYDSVGFQPTATFITGIR